MYGLVWSSSVEIALFVIKFVLFPPVRTGRSGDGLAVRRFRRPVRGGHGAGVLPLCAVTARFYGPFVVREKRETIVVFCIKQPNKSI